MNRSRSKPSNAKQKKQTNNKLNSVFAEYRELLCLNNSRYPAQPHPTIINYHPQTLNYLLASNVIP